MCMHHRRGVPLCARRWPGDCDIPGTWDEQVQTAGDCDNAGATMLHMLVRNPETGKSSTDCDQSPYFLGRLKAAVPQLAYHGRRFRS